MLCAGCVCIRLISCVLADSVTAGQNLYLLCLARSCSSLPILAHAGDTTSFNPVRSGSSPVLLYHISFHCFFTPSPSPLLSCPTSTTEQGGMMVSMEDLTPLTRLRYNASLRRYSYRPAFCLGYHTPPPSCPLTRRTRVNLRPVDPSLPHTCPSRARPCCYESERTYVLCDARWRAAPTLLRCSWSRRWRQRRCPARPFLLCCAVPL
ncbi:hypothetical protein FB45DRAFT_170051 [Roridomyces roridus]|uniref:Secreted protein n=1 Tax=Roridomyces roridus TaxID=1738132 RepID=A0AAD7FGG8_9AGAR|nr:hypothetical protein FB45DRAFT_170051 [Roridomyces roridus]